MAKRIQINITHVVNPSQFYFMKDDVLLNNDYDTDLNLQKYFRQNSSGLQGYSPKVNELVAVMNISDKRWMRASVDQVYNFSSTGPKYVLWAIDYGKPIVSKGTHIRPLPVEFQKDPSDIFFGGVINLLPAEMALDYMEMTRKLELRNKWSSTSCEIFEKLKENSEQCFFIVEEMRDGQYFGQLEIKNCLNKKFNLSQILCNENLALESEKNVFFERLKRCQLNTNSRWLSTDGDCKLLSYQNKYSTDIENNLFLAPLKEDTDGNSSSFKIREWNERNKRLMTSENYSENMNNQSDGEDSLSNIESVSVAENKLANLRNMEIKTRKLIEDDQHSDYSSNKMKLCGSNWKKRKEAFPPLADENFDFRLLSHTENLKLDAKLPELKSSTGIGKTASKMLSCEVLSTSDFSIKSDEKHKLELLKDASEVTKKSNANDDNLSVISDYSSISQKKYLAERRNKVLGKIGQKINSTEISNDDNLSKISQDNILAEHKLELLKDASEVTKKSNANDDNVSIISDYSSISQKKYLAERRNKVLGKIVQNSTEISNDDNLSKISQDNILAEHEIKSKVADNLEKSFNDTTQSIISDSSVTSREKFLALKRNKILGQKARGNESPICFKNTINSMNNTQESDLKNDCLKPSMEPEISPSEISKSLNSTSLSDISDFSKKSRERFLEQKRRAKQKPLTVRSGSNEVSSTNILTNTQDTVPPHHVAKTKPKEAQSEEKTKSNDLTKSTKLFTTPVVPLGDTNRNVSINDSVSPKPDAASLVTKKSEPNQKNNQLKESNRRVCVPAGYNVKCIETFKKENQIVKKKKNSREENQTMPTKNSSGENRSLPKQQNLITKQNELNYTRNRNNDRTKLEEINEVCLSDVSDFSKNLVLVHGAQISAPVYKIEKAKFSEIAYNGMRQLSNSSVYRIQQYSWKHILEGNSLVLINRPQTGKTLAYLPAICSLIHMEKEDNEVENDRGPICIIIAATRSDAFKIKYKCKNFICDNGKYNDHIVLFANSENEEDFNQALTSLFVGKDILICTPQCLYKLFSQDDGNLSNTEKERPYVKWFLKERLKHFVVDNYDLWNKEKRVLLAKCVKKLKLICDDGVQLVVTSNLWERSLESFFKLKSFKNPLLCIGAHIEAASYSGTHFSLKIVSNLKKIDCIKRFRIKYTQEQLVIVCTTDQETNFVFEELSKFFMCVKLTYENTAEEIENFARRWKNGNMDENEFLICSDEQLNLLNIQNAKDLIHYSLPDSWSKFSLRFSVLLNTYIDRVKSNFEETNQIPPNCLILLDEHNDDQLPKLINFLERIKCAIPSNLKELALKKEQEIENRMNAANVKICTKFLEFGNFHKKETCTLGRHVLNKNDDSYSHIPEKGIIKYDIINIFSPVHYAIRILNYKSSPSSNWIDYNKASKYAVFSVNFSTHFANKAHHIIHHPPKLYDVCVISDDNNFYRAQILQIIKGRPNSLRKTDNVQCKLLDDGRIETYPVSALLSLPDKFREFPYQAIDMRLTNVISIDEEDEWDEKLNKTIRKWLKPNHSEIAYFISQIDFTILNTLFLPEIVLSEKCSESITIHQMFIKKNLIKKNLVMRNTSVTDNLKAMALSLNILRELNQDEESDDIHLENSIKELNNENLLNIEENKKTKEAIVQQKSESSGSNKENLLKIEENKKTEKAIVQQKSESPVSNVASPNNNISNSKIEGSPLTTPMRGLRARPIRGLRKAGLKSKETWCNLVENQYTEVICSRYYSPNDFYLSIKECSSERNELYKKIDNYIAEGPVLITNLEIGTNCIAKLRKEYERCKIVEIVHDPSLKNVKAKVFYVDIGCIASRSIDNLYLSPKEIVEYLPYQAIRCKLSGGIWNEMYADDIYDELLEDCDCLFARPLSHEDVKDVVLKNTCYNVILVDCTTDTDVVINKKIIELGYGAADVTENINEEATSDGEENWDDENTGQVYVYKPPNEEQNIDFLNNEDDDDDEERVFDVNFDEDELNTLKRMMGLPDTAKFIPVDNDVNKTITSDSEKKPQKKSSVKNDQNESLNLSKQGKTENVIEEKDVKKHQLVMPDLMHNTNQNESLNLSKKEEINNILVEKELEIPNLMHNTNRPFVTWKQSEDYIRLEISAPDIDDYYLNVTANHLYFKALVQSEPKKLCIKFFGDVKPEHIFHEIRGLNVVVVLLKTIKDKKFLWPRLTEINEKNVLIKYDPNAIGDLAQEDDDENKVDLPINQNESSDDEDEDDDYFTSNPLQYAEEDDHDPFADGF